MPDDDVKWVGHLPPTQLTQSISITFMQCWNNVEDVGPTLYKCYENVLFTGYFVSGSLTDMCDDYFSILIILSIQF